jgi:hypothetical protein
MRHGSLRYRLRWKIYSAINIGDLQKNHSHFCMNCVVLSSEIAVQGSPWSHPVVCLLQVRFKFVTRLGLRPRISQPRPLDQPTPPSFQTQRCLPSLAKKAVLPIKARTLLRKSVPIPSRLLYVYPSSAKKK